jgi:NAD(P)-dependent dehydrogenase (short-subunit alcohol dehydrogenase family)
MLNNDGPYDGVAAYAMTKRGQVVLSEMWAEKLRPQGTCVAAMHPGWAKTPAVERSLPRFWQRMQNRLRTPAEGADTIVWLAVSPAAMRDTGCCWFDRRPVPTHFAWWTKEKPGERTRLWEMCRAHADV